MDLKIKVSSFSEELDQPSSLLCVRHCQYVLSQQFIYHKTCLEKHRTAVYVLFFTSPGESWNKQLPQKQNSHKKDKTVLVYNTPSNQCFPKQSPGMSQLKCNITATGSQPPLGLTYIYLRVINPKLLRPSRKGIQLEEQENHRML